MLPSKEQYSRLCLNERTRHCSGNHFFHDTFRSSEKNLISYWCCCFTNFNVSLEKHSIFVNVQVFLPWMSLTFSTPTPRERHKSKKLDVKIFLFSSSRETQKCNGRKSRQSKLLSLVQKQLQKYNIRDKRILAQVVSYGKRLRQIWSKAITDLHFFTFHALFAWLWELLLCLEILI